MRINDKIKEALFQTGTAAVIIIAGIIAANRLINIPKRMEVVIAITLLFVVPVLKYPLVGVYFLFIEPVFTNLFRRFYYTLYERPSFDPFIIISFVILGFITMNLADRLMKRDLPDIAENSLYRLVLVFFIYMVSRAVVLNETGLKQAILNQPAGLMWNVFILMLFAGAVLVQKKETIYKIVFITIILGIATAIFGIKQVYFGFTRGEQIWLDWLRSEGKFTTLFIAGIPRSFSTFSSPACFADFMMISVFSVIFFVAIRKINVLWLAAAIPMIYAMLLTSVRSNWISFGVGIVFWFFVLRFKSSSGKLISLIFTILLFVVIDNGVDYISEKKENNAFIAMQKARIEYGKKDKRDILEETMIKGRATALRDPLGEHSMRHRLWLWKLILKESVTRFQGILGFGVGTFDAHSYYLSLLRCLGFPGLILFLVILYKSLKIGLKRFDNAKEVSESYLMRYLLTVIFMICVINITGVHISFHPADIYFWFFMGIIVNTRWSMDSKKEDNGHV